LTRSARDEPRRDGARDAPGLARTGIAQLHGVGPRVAERLAAIGVATVQDLLFHLPLRYQDRTRIAPIASVRAGQELLVCGEIRSARVNLGRRRSLLAVIADASGALTIRFFHFSAAQEAALKPGLPMRCFGEVRRGPSGLEMVHPEYRVGEPGVAPELDDRLTPVYASTEGVGQNTWRHLTDQALVLLERGAVEELLPRAVLQRFDFPSLDVALASVHRPSPEVSLERLNNDGHPGVRRLAFEELTAQQLALKRLRRQLDRQPAPRIAPAGELAARFERALPFALTGAQRRVSDQIARDLARPHPMHRLLQGDVGSGKTVVAALAMLRAIEAGHQAALMAPTEILAEQHHQTFTQWLEPLGVGVTWLSGRLGAAARRRAREAAAAGSSALVVGTHALFQDGTTFARLGLVVVDEQHRFGVDQRLALRNKAAPGEGMAHQLIMTATPIPRTLAMAAYADLDTSVIDELPPGRTPVDTAVVPETRRADVVQRVHAACAGGQQAYWVCTLIDESDALEAQAAEDTRDELARALPDLRVALVHGRMKPAEKEAVMARFKAGEIQLLVATTVIEVGVDVPNASLMIIDNAERLGLSQLHQLRGRVGRGARKSVCVMLYRAPLGATARARLEVMRNTTDGFEVAQRDLELRGPGEVLGTRQTGLLKLRVADLVRDHALVPQAADAADMILAQHSAQVAPLIRRWVGDGVHYAHV
jgi:ATP-dependent DNA helicase RecG